MSTKNTYSKHRQSLDQLKKDLRRELENQGYLPKSNPDDKLEWHHQAAGSGKKIGDAKNYDGAVNEIISGVCIPLTEAEHKKIHINAKGFVPVMWNGQDIVPAFNGLPLYVPQIWNTEINNHRP